MQQVSLRLGKVPELPAELAYLLDYWREIHPASLSEIAAWQGLKGLRLAPWEAMALRQLERIWQDSSKKD